MTNDRTKAAGSHGGLSADEKPAKVQDSDDVGGSFIQGPRTGVCGKTGLVETNAIDTVKSISGPTDGKVKEARIKTKMIID